VKAIELAGAIARQHRLKADLPVELPAGQIRVIALLPDDDETGSRWAQGIAPGMAGRPGGREPGYLHSGRRPARECGEVMFSSCDFPLAMCLG
jgi:hypothetical protein